MKLIVGNLYKTNRDSNFRIMSDKPDLYLVWPLMSKGTICMYMGKSNRGLQNYLPVNVKPKICLTPERDYFLFLIDPKNFYYSFDTVEIFESL